MPDTLAELYFCERIGWQIMPTGLSPGSINDQPVDALFRWMQIMGLESSEREKLEAIRIKQNR